jgi:hypothetical protein
MRLYKFSLFVHIFSAIALLVVTGITYERSATQNESVEWPGEFEGQALIELELSPGEIQFVKDFPGQIGRFTDGNREVILRYVKRETRLLHPSADCLRASGYSVQPLPMRVDAHDHFWGCSEAKKGSERVKVCERIYDQVGNSYSDVSTWYWAAILNSTNGPWWAVTVAEKL